jgi:hypothetical protein
MGHMVVPELPSQEARARSRGTLGSTEAHLSGRQSPEPLGHVAAPKLTSQGGKDRAEGHMAALDLTSAQR